jgi:hypothetical protein
LHYVRRHERVKGGYDPVKQDYLPDTYEDVWQLSFTGPDKEHVVMAESVESAAELIVCLNQLGADGWELVHGQNVSVNGPHSTDIRFYFKRPRPRD